MALTLLLRNEFVIIFILTAPEFTTAVIIDVHEWLTLLILGRKKHSHHLLPLLVLLSRFVLIQILREEVCRCLSEILLLYLLQITSNAAGKLSLQPATAFFNLLKRSHVHD